MMSDQQAVIGTTAAFHLSRATVKLNHAITTKTGHYHVALDAHPATRVYLAHRSLVQIVGPVSVSLVGPASADIVASATATIAATRATSWPDTVLKVADAAESQNLATSALSAIPRAVLEFHPDINCVLKPPSPVITRSLLRLGLSRPVLPPLPWGPAWRSCLILSFPVPLGFNRLRGDASAPWSGPNSWGLVFSFCCHV